MVGPTEPAGELARGFVECHRLTEISYKLPLVGALVGSALPAARVNGLERVGHVRDKLSWLVAYAETLRALTHHAAERCKVVDGIAIPDTLLVNIAKLQRAGPAHRVPARPGHRGRPARHVPGHLQELCEAL